VIAGVFSGIELGVWFNYQFGLMNPNEVPYPLTLDFSDIFSLTARTVLGLIIAGAVEYLGKLISYSVLCKLVDEDKHKLKASENSVYNTNKNFVDLTSKFFTYCLLGSTILIVVPQLYTYFNIQRDAFFNEL